MIKDIVTTAAGALSGVINLVPAIGNLTILPIIEVGPVPLPAGLPYVVQFNPETYSVTEGIHYDDSQATGSATGEQRFCKKKEPQYSFEFTLDGTGASGEKKEVADEIHDFKAAVGFNGNEHKPNSLVLVWGDLIKICVLTQMNVKYSLMRNDGTPLRAVISATFAGHTIEVVGSLIENLLSPDLTHRRMVKGRDTLPLMCANIYNKPHYYIEVASANGLTNFRRLKPGITLDFPPIDK